MTSVIAHPWRRWTGIEPASPRNSGSAVLKTVETTRYSDTSAGESSHRSPGEFSQPGSGYQRRNFECGCNGRPEQRRTAMRIARITRRVASVVSEMNYGQRRLVAVLMGCKDS